MGYQLMQTAMARGSTLNANPFKVLMRMCFHALDKPNAKGQPPDLYFGGWRPLALAIGHDPEGADRKREKKLEAYVSRAVDELEAAGLVQRMVEKPGAQRQQVHRLLLHVVPPREGDKTSDGSPPSKGGQSPPLSGGQVSPHEWGDCPPLKGGPRSNQEEREDPRQDTQLASPSRLKSPRAIPTACPSCGAGVTVDGDCTAPCGWSAA